MRDRLWFFGGHQYLRDYDSQPGRPRVPETLRAEQVVRKLTWSLAPTSGCVQSIHHE